MNSMENKEKFGKLIIWLRERDGLSQKDLAEKMYVTPSTVCKWEKGSSVPDNGKLMQISELFQIPYEDLLDPEETLLRLKSTPTMPEPKQKYIWRWIAVAAVVCMCFAVVIVLFVTREKSAEWKILDTYEQYIEDPDYGTVYEIIYVVNIYPDIQTISQYSNEQVSSYVQELQLDADVVKIAFCDEATIKENDDPGFVTYLFLNNYEED